MIHVRYDKRSAYIALTRASAQEYIDRHPEAMRQRMDVVEKHEPKNGGSKNGA